MSRTNDKTAETGQDDPILPAPVGEDGLVQPERGEGEVAGKPKREGGGASGEDAHDLAHGNDLRTP